MKLRKKADPQSAAPSDLRESEVSILSEGSRFDGTLELDSVARFHGHLKGTLKGSDGSLIILGETGQVEGQIEADTVWIEGFVQGKVRARTKILLAPTARVLADLESPAIEIQPGAHFDGACRMEKIS